MVFASLSFLFIFLVPVLALYFLLPERYRNYGLFAAGLLFYYLGAREYLPLLLLEVVWGWLSGLAITRAAGGKKKALLILFISAEIGVMAFFKYAGWLSGLFRDAGWFSGFFKTGSPFKDLVLPVGISFYSFQAVSYAVDVYRGVKPQQNPVNFGLYLTFFPQLIAGPIVRYPEIEKQLAGRRVSADGISRGLIRFSAGLCKKVLLANSFGQLSDHVFETVKNTELSSAMLWLGALGYTLQIFFDFSGYSDMAIGLGAMFGFKIPENFDDPYTAVSASDFWRRWHMTLSRWFRDYVYIPLGGNRNGFLRECLNLMIVWGLTGLWHGAGATFLVWGLLWGVLLILEKGLIRPEEKGIFFRTVYRCFILLYIMGLWVIFRAPDLMTAEKVLSGMFAFRTAAERPLEFSLWLRDMAPYLAAGIFLSAGGMRRGRALFRKIRDTRVSGAVYAAYLGGLFAMTLLSVSFLVNSSYNPFLYFMF